MVKYVDVYKEDILIAKTKYLTNFLLKLKGLMFCKSLNKEEGIILVANNEGIFDTAIHMFFVFFPIDVVWLNKNLEVVDYKRNIKPFTPFIKPKKSAKYILELPINSTQNLSLGDKLNFKYLKSKYI